MGTQDIEAARIYEGDRRSTVNRPKPIPIVFIPGVMGSRLRFTAVNDTWDPDSKLNMVGWASSSVEGTANALNTATGPGEPLTDAIDWDSRLAEIWKKVDPKQDPRFYGRTRGWAGASKTYYREVLVALEATFNAAPFAAGDHPVYAFGYDWRASNALSAAKLAARVGEVLARHGADKVILVTHSMGGLVARHACAPGGCGLAGKVKGVVHVVQPCDGAVMAYRRFAEGIALDREGGLEGKVMGAILGGSWWGYAMIMSGTQGPVQLLPNHVYGGWLTSETGAPVPAAGIYALYAGGSPMSVVRELDDRSLGEVAASTFGDAPDFMTRYGESVAMGEGGAQMAAEILKIRRERAKARWPAYCTLLRGSLKTAELFHGIVAGYAHPRTFMLYAGGLRTEVGYRWNKKTGERAERDAAGGDATVPIASAKGLDAAVKAHWTGVDPEKLGHKLVHDVGAVEHAGCFTPAVIELVKNRVRVLRMLP